MARAALAGIVPAPAHAEPHAEIDGLRNHMPLSQAQIQSVRALIESGRLPEAKAALQRALLRGPDLYGDTMMSYVLNELGEHTQALFYSERSIAASPADPGLRRNAARALIGLRRYEEAQAQYERAIAAAPDEAASHAGLASALQMQGRIADSLDALRAARARFPGERGVAFALASGLNRVGLSREAVAVTREIARANPADTDAWFAFASHANYAGGLSPAEVFGAHVGFGEALRRSVAPPQGWKPSPAPTARDKRPLRIGLLSPDLRAHAVTVFLEPILEGLDREAFEVVCFSASGVEDEVSQRLRGHAHAWRRVFGMQDASLAQAIRRESIDVLIELAGLTPGQRLGALTLRPAPVQATYLGYPNTTGVREIDFRLVDSVASPPGAAVLAVEALAPLDPCFLCYRPSPGAPEPAPAPSLGGAPFTFGSFNNISKLDEDVVALWSRILLETPGSRLALMHLATLDPRAPQWLPARFGAHGVDPARILVSRPFAGVVEVCRAYSVMDVALDPFPFNGATTTCDALYMGVPVVALEGDRFSSRQCASVLRAAGRGAWVAPTTDAYAALAVSLARDPALLARERDGLRAAFLRSPVCDAPAFCRRFEAAIRAMWSSACDRGAR